MRSILYITIGVTIPLLIEGCFPQAEIEAKTTKLSQRHPNGELAIDEAISFVFSDALEIDADISVLSSGGESIPCAIQWHDSEQLTLHPLPHWPENSLLKVSILGLRDQYGQEVLLSEQDVVFRVKAARRIETPAELSVLHPQPGKAAGPSLKYLQLDNRGHPFPDFVELLAESSTHTLVARRIGFDASHGLFRLVHSEARRGLMPGKRYLLKAGRAPVAKGEQGSVLAAEQHPPIVEVGTSTRSFVYDREVSIQLSSSEAVLIVAELRDAQDRILETIEGRSFSTQHRLVFSELEPKHDYRLTLRLEDLYGNHHRLGPLAVRTEEPLTLALSEVVTTPYRDWGDSSPRGKPFDHQPGTGTVSSADEWVELVNISGRSLDLTQLDLHIDVLDGSPSRTYLGSAPQYYFGAEGELSKWLPGEAMVLSLQGELSQRPLELQLKWGEQLLDRWRLGLESKSDHPGGRSPQPDFEAVARDSSGYLRWCIPSPGWVEANPRCLDR